MKFINEHKHFLIESIGVLASIIGLLSFRAMLYKIYTTKNTIDFPYESLILTLIGWILMFIYGLIKKSIGVIVLGFVYFNIFLFIFIIKVTHPDNK